MKPIYEIENISQGYVSDDVYADEDLAVRIAERLTKETGYTHLVKEVV